MSISYHGVVGHTSRVTLPSVDMYNMNMNILRDPPKGIQTRRIDKVGEISDITQMIQESGDRVCEGISVYARGQNPMVAVSYNNSGSQSIQTGGSRNVGGQSYLPYRILTGGAFRPPARDQRDLLPLSRLPRVWTSSYSQPGFADFSKKAMVAGTDLNTKGVKTPGQMLKPCAHPTATFRLETPIVETYEVRNVIRNPEHIYGFSGITTQTRVNGVRGEATQEIIEQPMHVDANMNLGNSRMQRNIDISNFDTSGYTHESMKGHVMSNASRNIQSVPVSVLDTDGNIKNSMNITYDTNHVTYTKQEYIHNPIELENVLPPHEGHTNKRQNIYHKVVEPFEKVLSTNRPATSCVTNMGTRDRQSIDNITNRDYVLKPTITAGSYNPNPERPMLENVNQLPEFDQNRVARNKFILEMQQGRN